MDLVRGKWGLWLSSLSGGGFGLTVALIVMVYIVFALNCTHSLKRPLSMRIRNHGWLDWVC